MVLGDNFPIERRLDGPSFFIYCAIDIFRMDKTRFSVWVGITAVEKLWFAPLTKLCLRSFLCLTIIYAGSRVKQVMHLYKIAFFLCGF